MPHHHLEGQPIEVPLGEARHSEELKLFPIALVQQVCSRLYHRCSCQLFRSVAYDRVCHFMAKNHLQIRFFMAESHLHIRLFMAKNYLLIRFFMAESHL